MSNTKETEIKVKDNTVLLKSLRNDIIEASTTLTVIKTEVDEQDAILGNKVQEIAILEQKTVDINAGVEEERKAISQAKIDLENAKRRSEKELEVLNKQKRSAMSELRRLNEWTHNAREEKESLKLSISELLSLEKEKKEVIIDIGEFRSALLEVKEEYREILVDTKLAQESSEAELDRNNRGLQKLQEQILVLDDKKAMLELSMAETLRNQKEIQVDLGIYEKRIKEKYEKEFPNKTIKLRKK